jgi:DNA-binding CsgD family transcriptional regulator
MPIILSNADQQLLFELIMMCHEETPNSFDLAIYPKLRELLPHDMFAYGFVNARDGRLQQLVNTSFPEGYLHQCKRVAGEVVCGVVRKWSRSQQPVYYDQKSSHRKAISKSNPGAPFSEFGLRNIVLHGVMDFAKTTGSCYGFASLADNWNQRSATILRMVTPHLHAAITSHTTSPLAITAAVTDNFDAPLTTRELSVLQLLSEGKSNIEIGESLTISVFTVRAHIQNIMRKLCASNRVQAITRGIRSGLIHL